MLKIDLRKQYKRSYSPSSRPVSIIDVPVLKFVMVNGIIESGKSPGASPTFKLAMEA